MSPSSLLPSDRNKCLSLPVTYEAHVSHCGLLYPRLVFGHPLLDFLDSSLTDRYLARGVVMVATQVVMNVVVARQAMPYLRSIRLYPGGGFSPRTARIGTFLFQGFVALVAFVAFNAACFPLVLILIRAFTGYYSKR
jgi:hypothetical protein